MSTLHFYCVLCGASLQASSKTYADLIKCRACLRSVPVPKLANFFGETTDYLPALPPDVLELSVKFRCKKCRTRLRTDARWEGRGIACPHCGDQVEVPRWSGEPHSSETHDATPAHSDVQSATLSTEEIDFLRGVTSGNPGAAA